MIMVMTNLHLFLHDLHQNKPLSAQKRFSQTGGRREEFFPDDVLQYQVCILFFSICCNFFANLTILMVNIGRS